MGQRAEHGRLSGKDRLEIRDRIHRGQTHAQVAGVIGCSTKSIQRLLNLPVDCRRDLEVVRQGISRLLSEKKFREG